MDTVPVDPALAADQQVLETFRALVEATSIAIVSVDGTGVIQLANPAIEEMFGYPSVELIGSSIDMLVPAAVRSAHESHRRGYLAEPRTRKMGEGQDLRARRKDGSSFPVEIALSPIAVNNTVWITAAVNDISARVKTDELKAQLEHEVQISRRMESLGQLAGGVAHEFNNMLGIILNHASFVRDDLSNLNASEHNETLNAAIRDIERIEDAGRRATRQTRQLLTFGRREIGQPRQIDLNDAVTYMHRLLANTLGTKVDLVAVRGQGTTVVFADPGEIEQVLVNLALNARDAMPKGGTVRLETDCIVADEAFTEGRNLAAGSYVRLRVSDGGTGMSPDVAQRAFEPFYTTKQMGDAQGLGLTHVYTIVNTAGGHVSIYSELDHGTTVTVLLPAVGVDAGPVDSPPEPVSYESAGQTILLAEDEEGIRAAAIRLLTQAGYTLLVAETGHAALDIANSHAGTIDLLLTDIVMPGMNGRDLAERLLSQRPETAVLFMSGYAHGILTAQGDLDADVSLLEKPFTKADLLAKVAQKFIQARS